MQIGEADEQSLMSSSATNTLTRPDQSCKFIGCFINLPDHETRKEL